MKKLNNSRTLLLILIIGAASFATQGCTPSAVSAPAGQPTDPTNPEQTRKVQDTGIYKALTSLGFDISTEKVEAIDGQYQPKTGDITSLSYRQVDNSIIAYNYTLDRENSTENSLIYKGKIVNERYSKSFDTENNTIKTIVETYENLSTLVEAGIPVERYIPFPTDYKFVLANNYSIFYRIDGDIVRGSISSI